MSRVSVFIAALLACAGISVSHRAYSTPPPASAVVSAGSTQQTQSRNSQSRQVLEPGDRHCLRDTGSLIPPKKGRCLPVHGSSYSGDELRRTGTSDNARALQMLDPSISVGH